MAEDPETARPAGNGGVPRWLTWPGSSAAAPSAAGRTTRPAAHAGRIPCRPFGRFPLPSQPSDRCCPMLSAWPWLMLAALLLLPVVLRFRVREEPDNAITHEQDGSQDEDGGRRDPDLLAAA